MYGYDIGRFDSSALPKLLGLLTAANLLTLLTAFILTYLANLLEYGDACAGSKAHAPAAART